MARWMAVGALGGAALCLGGCLSLGRMEAAAIVGHTRTRTSPDPRAATPVEARAADGTRLHGWYVPARGGASRGLVMLVHGRGDDASFWADEAEALASRGFDAAAFDLRGHGRSSGPSTMGAREPDDLSVELDALAALGVDTGRTLAYGYSLGAVVSIRAAARDPRVRAVLAVAPFARADDVVRRVARPAPRRMLDRAIRSAERTARFSLAAVDTVDAARRLDRPLVIVAGTDDTAAPPLDGLRIAAAARGPVELLLVRGARHTEVLPRCGPACDRALGRLAQAAGMHGPATRPPPPPIAGRLSIQVEPEMARSARWTRAEPAIGSDAKR